MSSSTQKTISIRSSSYMNHNDKSSDFLFPPRRYGSMNNSDIMKQTSTSSLSKSHGASLSPNDDDQSLYLLWTHQLLVERGFTPSAIDNDDASSTSSISAENDDDNEFSMLFSTSPSVSSPSYTNSTYMMGMDSTTKVPSIASSSSSASSSLYSTFSFSSWFSYCFPK